MYLYVEGVGTLKVQRHKVGEAYTFSSKKKYGLYYFDNDHNSWNREEAVEFLEVSRHPEIEVRPQEPSGN